LKRSTTIGLAVAGLTAAATAAAAKVAASSNHRATTIPDRAEPAMEPGVDGDAFLEHLGQAVRLSTVVFEDRSQNDPADITAFHEFLRDAYPLTHQTCAVETINELSLLYTWEGSDPQAEPMVLMAHMDVVPIEPGTEGDWTHGPFSGELADGHLWGRGVLDDKGPLIAMIEAVEHLIAAGFEPTRTIHLAFGHDEELGGAQGGREVAATLRDRGVRPWLVLDEFGIVADSLPPLSKSPVALVKVAEKGYLNVKLTARTAGGHSSEPPASTAVGQIGAAVHRLETHPLPARVGVLGPFFAALTPVMDPKIAAVLNNLRITGPIVAKLLGAKQETNSMIRTSTAVTMVSGGVKPNVLPQEAWAVVNFRILPGDSAESVLAHVHDVVGPGIGIEPFGEMRSEPSPSSSTDSEAWAGLRRTIEETFPDSTVAPWIMPGATDSRFYMPFAGDVYGFGPFTTDMSEVRGVHGTDEAMRAADADGAVSFFCRLLRNAQP
jgi:carboxypeptidase PM20D1